MADYEFGSNFTANHTIWVLRFVSERVGSITTGTLIRDIDGLPLYTNLDETATFSPEVFETQDSVTKNVYFVRNDNL